MPRWIGADYRSPGAGLANALRPHLLRADEFSMLKNMWLRAGNLVKRGGAVQQGDAPDAAVVRWLFNAYDTAGSAIVNRLRFCNGKIQYLTGGAWTNLVTGLTATTYPTAVQYQDKVWICDATMSPRRVTIASPPTITTWSGLPSGINPALVVLQNNRLYFCNDTSTPQYVYMCDPGTPETTQVTEFYQIPDMQAGNFPKAMVNCLNGILFLCQDYLVYMTGDGPLSHRLWHRPRGAACVAWRTAVDMGDFGAIYLTERGLYMTDGTSPSEPLDPYGKINWSDVNLTTETDTWAVRYGDIYLLWYRSKGDTTGAATQTAYGRFSTLYAARSNYTKATSASQTSHYIAYDCRLKQFVGMGTGNYSCGAWEQYRSGDTQDLWLGQATTGGEVHKWDQAGTWQDDGVSYECIAKTGAVSPDPFQLYTVDKIQLKTSVVKSAACAAEIRVYFNGETDETRVAWKKDVNIGSVNTVGEDGSNLEPVVDLDDQVVKNVRPAFDDGSKKGLDPQIEIRHTGSTEFEIRGISVNVTPTRGDE